MEWICTWPRIIKKYLNCRQYFRYSKEFLLTYNWKPLHSQLSSSLSGSSMSMSVRIIQLLELEENRIVNFQNNISKNTNINKVNKIKRSSLSWMIELSISFIYLIYWVSYLFSVSNKLPCKYQYIRYNLKDGL